MSQAGPPESAARRREIALARAPVPLIAWLGVRLFVAEVALIVAGTTPGMIGLAVMAVGIIVLLYAIGLALHVLSLRLFVSDRSLELKSMLFRRSHRRSGAVVRRQRITAGQGAFHTVLGGFGIELGRGRTADGEEVEVIRLAPLGSVVIIPCDGIQVAVAPASERALLLALARV